MAERLKTFDFTAQSAITSAESKGRNRYPWGDWFDGDIWMIEHGVDFDTSPLMMERIIRTRASNKNHRAKVTLRHIPPLNGESAAIVMQRTDIVGPTQQKKLDAAAKRAEKKAAATKDAEQTLAAAGMTPKKVNGTAKKSISKRPAKKAPAAKAPVRRKPPAKKALLSRAFALVS